MTGDTRIERALPTILEDLGAGPTPDYAGSILARTASISQRPGWTFPGTWLPTAAADGRVASAPRIPWATVGLIALLVLALAVGAVIVGSQRPRLPALVVPVGNGLIAFASSGDIFVGDPGTGTTTAIVTDPEVDSRPIFSPDGSRIAFLRGDPWTQDAGIVVVRADGSEGRVVMPAGFSMRGTDFTWTPDGASLLVNHDSEPLTTPYFDGELSLFDATGMADPRLLTPPLPIGPGGPYFRYTAQVAPMFRPPNGDAILSAANDPQAIDPDCCPGSLEQLYVWDVDLDRHNRLIPRGIEGFEPHFFSPWGLWWSPDGSMIAFVIGGSPSIDGFYVMEADGTNVRHLEGVDASAIAWSPDSTKLAFQRCSTTPAGEGSVIVIVDVVSGAERVLQSTSVETKTEGAALPRPPESAGQPLCGFYQGPTGRAWDYEGWSWSPDGQSIVMLERAGTRPMVVDVETGQATELPWEADEGPSWQRAPGD